MRSLDLIQASNKPSLNWSLPDPPCRDAIARLYQQYKDPGSDVILAEGIATLCEDLGAPACPSPASRGQGAAYALRAGAAGKAAGWGGAGCRARASGTQLGRLSAAPAPRCLLALFPVYSLVPWRPARVAAVRTRNVPLAGGAARCAPGVAALYPATKRAPPARQAWSRTT